MKAIQTAAIGLLLMAYCEATGQVPYGFDVLFNGDDFTGWIIKAKPEDAAKEYWKVEDGAFVVNSVGDTAHDYVWLMTEMEFDNFELQLKFTAYSSSPGNSGIQVRSRYDEENFWLDGPQIDIHPPQPWRTGFIWDETRGEKRWIYPDLPADEWVNENMRKRKVDLLLSSDGEEKWNNLEIYADGNKIQAWLNGEQITDFKGKEVLNNDAHKQFDVGKKGHICLQLHTGDELKMKFKDIFIKQL